MNDLKAPFCLLFEATTNYQSRVPTDTYLFKGVPHGLRRFGQLSESKRWDAVLDHAVKWSLSKPEAGDFKIKVHGP